MPSGYLTTLATDLLKDAGTFYNNSSTPFGVTKGPIVFDPGETIQNIDFAGKRTDIYLLDRYLTRLPKFTMTIIALNTTIAPILLPGSTSSTSGSVTTITPASASSLFTSSYYMSNARALWVKGDGNLFGAKFAKALPQITAIRGVDKDTAEIDLTVTAKLDLTSSTDTDASSVVLQFLATP